MENKLVLQNDFYGSWNTKKEYGGSKILDTFTMPKLAFTFRYTFSSSGFALEASTPYLN